MSDQPKVTEPVPVQLTRIEGSVNLIAERVGNVQGQLTDLRADVTHLSQRVSAVELVQAASTGSATSWRTWVPTLVAAGGLVIALVLALTGG